MPRICEDLRRAFSLGKAILCWYKKHFKDLGTSAPALAKLLLVGGSEKHAEVPWRRPSCPADPLHPVLATWAFALRCQLVDCSWLAKLTLQRTDSQEEAPQLNLDVFLFRLPFAWNSSVIDLSSVWSMLFLYWLIKRCYSVCYWLVKYYYKL